MKCKICQHNEVDTTDGECWNCYYTWELWDKDPASWKFEKRTNKEDDSTNWLAIYPDYFSVGGKL